MFHTYVLAASGNMVDIDRASFLMDKGLLQQALSAMKEEVTTCPQPDASYGPQWIWGYYCERHAEKYGESFEPDVSPTWDQGGTPAREFPPPPEEEIKEFLAGLPFRGRTPPAQT